MCLREPFLSRLYSINYLADYLVVHCTIEPANTTICEKDNILCDANLGTYIRTNTRGSRWFTVTQLLNPLKAELLNALCRADWISAVPEEAQVSTAARVSVKMAVEYLKIRGRFHEFDSLIKTMIFSKISKDINSWYFLSIRIYYNYFQK